VAGPTERTIAEQEACFARAFAAGDLSVARPLYHPDVTYVSPTVRLFGWPAVIEGVERTLEFIALTVRHVRDVRYRAVECAINGESAFVVVEFDFTREDRRLRSRYVVLYRYRDGLIVRQELYYDPSGRLEELAR
jgi:ketosteroid isomerase-like protein